MDIRSFFKTILVSMGLAAGSLTGNAAPLRVEPPMWWTGMQTPLTLMIYGENIIGSNVTVDSPLITIKEIHNAQSPNYLFVDLAFADDITPGLYKFAIEKDGKQSAFEYRLCPRREGSRTREGFGSEDVVYLIMPDRFANGDPSNDKTKLTAEKADRKNPDARHGGDLQGIMDHLDYLADLGITAIWPTPIMLDNEPVFSYHGYACSDYYLVDPRYGTNELYKELVAKAHAKGIKFIQDIVPNHSGTAHWWYNDLPFENWIHVKDTFTRSNYAMSVHSDPHASKLDTYDCVTGWFDTTMPDMDLSNPYCLQYYIQMAVWWIEYADLDGVRVDTFPYTAKEDIAAWTAGIINEYPNITVVGECWFHNAEHIAYWEGSHKNPDGYTSNLSMVMDFPLADNMVAFTQNENLGWDDGIKRLYNSISLDFAYNNPYNILTFMTNHDMDRPATRFGANVDSDETVAARMKLATTFILTTRGTPQLYYGDEIMMYPPADMVGKGDTWRREDFPGGWKSDKKNAFTRKGRTAVQNDLFDHTRILLQWRKGSKAVTGGKLLHFLPYQDLNNVYVYFRYTEDLGEVVMVILNNSTESVKIDPSRYAEILDKVREIRPSSMETSVDLLSFRKVNLNEEFSVAPMTSMVVLL